MFVWFTSPVGIIWLTATLCLAVLSLMRYGWRAPVLISSIGVAALLGAYGITAIPLPEDVGLPQSALVYDRNGKLIGSLGTVRRYIIDTADLPRHVRQAVIAAEDRGFYGHGGVSLTSIVRASLANLAAGHIEQGGSTITQQYVKNALIEDSSRTLIRKLREAALAVKLEDRYSKEQILDFYLNTIYWGRGTYGIEAAAKVYFDKHAHRLTLAESALLAGIIRAPERLQPSEHPGAARARRNHVLQAMADEGYITESRAERAGAERLRLVKGAEKRAGKVRAAYFMEWLRRDVLEKEFGECLYRCGLRIHTTLDLDVQRHAEAAIGRALERRQDPEAALVAMSPDGEVLALVGGRSFRSAVAASGFNLASDLPGRHAGSALKPFTLAAALEDGISPTTSLSGASPRIVRESACRRGDTNWRVENYGGSSYGSVTLTSATALSVNTAYAQLAERVGPAAIGQALAKFGFDRKGSEGERILPPYCSLALGALDVTPLEMTRAYAGLARGGLLPPVAAVSYVEDSSGRCLKAFRPVDDLDCEEMEIKAARRALDAGTAEVVTDVLEGVVDYGTAAGIDLSVTAAGKTGTSQNNTDAWFAGYTDQLAAAVWVGYTAEGDGQLVPQMRRCPDRERCRPVRGDDVTGGTVPARIWADFMERALAELAGGDPVAEDDGGVPVGPAPPPSTPAFGEPPIKPERDEPKPPRLEPRPSPSGGGGLPVPLPLPTP